MDTQKYKDVLDRISRENEKLRNTIIRMNGPTNAPHPALILLAGIILGTVVSFFVFRGD